MVLIPRTFFTNLGGLTNCSELVSRHFVKGRPHLINGIKCEKLHIFKI